VHACKRKQLFSILNKKEKEERNLWGLYYRSGDKVVTSDINELYKRVTHMHANLKLNIYIYIKPSIQINFGLHRYLSYDEIFKTRPPLPMFTGYFLKIFLILNN
jgi:hypothetical protein